MLLPGLFSSHPSYSAEVPLGHSQGRAYEAKVRLLTFSQVPPATATSTSAQPSCPPMVLLQRRSNSVMSCGGLQLCAHTHTHTHTGVHVTHDPENPQPDPVGRGIGQMEGQGGGAHDPECGVWWDTCGYACGRCLSCPEPEPRRGPQGQHAACMAKECGDDVRRPMGCWSSEVRSRVGEAHGPCDAQLWAAPSAPLRGLPMGSWGVGGGPWGQMPRHGQNDHSPRLWWNIWEHHGSFVGWLSSRSVVGRLLAGRSYVAHLHVCVYGPHSCGAEGGLW